MIPYLIILLLLSLYILRLWRKNKNYWLEKGVPYEAPHPIWGSLTFLQKENPAIWMIKSYEKFQSPYVGMWLFWRPGLVVNSPEIAKNILVKDADVFRNRFLSSGKSDPTGALNLFTVNDPLWSSLRRKLTSVFTASKLRGLQDLTIRKSNDLIQRIYDEMDDVISVRNICTDFTTDVIGEAAFGVVSESAKTGDSVLRKVTREFMAFNIHRGLSWSSIFFFPELVDIFGFSFFPKDTIEDLRHLIKMIIQQRGGYDRKIKNSKDLLDALLKVKNEADNKEEITEDVLLAQAAVFLLGGFDTSGTTIAWTIYQLAHNPIIQHTLYNELSERKCKLGDGLLDSSVLAELPYLNAVIKETLRIFPSMGWLDRIPSTDYEIDENLTIKAGTVVYVNAVGMHRDPNHFPNPETFDPERFLKENQHNIKAFTFMPFGEGPRSCIGKRFALQTVRFGLANIVLNFIMESVPKTPKPIECKIEKKGMFLTPGEDLYVRFKPRNRI